MIGGALVKGGLTPRALAAWAGTDRLSALPALVPRLAGREVTPPAGVLALLVAGVEVPVAKLGAIEFSLEPLARLGILELAGGVARARVAVLPVGASVVICDRLDAPSERDLVCWPDDSSYHLLRALPTSRQRGRWLDLCCGSAFAQIASSYLADALAATDLNPRAVRYARLGAELSGIEHLELLEGDLVVPPAWSGSSNLVTCNAPIPGDDSYRPLWREAGADIVARVFAAAAGALAPGGMAIVHAAEDALAPVIAELPGERVVVAYTPEGVRGFAVAWWRPQAPPRSVVTRRTLTSDRPHLDHADYTSA